MSRRATSWWCAGGGLVGLEDADGGEGLVAFEERDELLEDLLAAGRSVPAEGEVLGLVVDGEAPEAAAALLVEGEEAHVGLDGIVVWEVQQKAVLGPFEAIEVGAQAFDELDARGDL